MDKKEMRRCLWWLEDWQLAEQEAWLEDMSKKGWHLVKTNVGRATFEKGTPWEYRYRCDVFKADDWSEQERLQLYQDAGWEHVANRGLVQIFRASNNSTIPEIHTDPLEQARNVGRLLPGRLASFLFPLLFLSFAFYVKSPRLAQLLLQSDWLTFLSTLFFLFWILMSIVALRHLGKYMARLRRGSQPPRSVRWRQAMRLAQLRGALVILTCILLLGGRFVTPLMLRKPPFPPIPEGPLPVVRLSQVLDVFQYADSIPNQGYYAGKGDVFNYFRQDSSLLVPEQYFLAESARLQSSGVDASTIYFHCDTYRAVSPSIAKALAGSLASERPLYPTRSSLPLQPASDAGSFAGLWLLEDEDQKEVIAWQDSWVYHLSCSGSVPLEQIIGALVLHTEP